MALLILLQIISWPFVRRMFSRLPDRGWAFARPVSILLGGLIIWFPASFGIVPFTPLWSMIAMALLAAFCWLFVRRIGVSPGERIWKDIPMAVTAEWVFWMVFVIFLLFRAINPDSYHIWWGGEKPMEFAHLNAILRSESMPPYDPWYAGGLLNYYYFGTFLVANLVQITGIPAEIAFNLATPLFPAMLASAAFSIGAIFGKRLTASNLGAALAGLASVFFVQFAGNMVVASRLWDRAINHVTSPAPFVYWVWEPTRAIPVPALQINITEFPYFSALYADLHPHTMAMPYTMMGIALAWQIAASWRTVPLLFVRRRLSQTHQLEILAPFVLLGMVVGSLWMINAWDMPMTAAMGVLGLTMMTIRVPSIAERIAIIVGGTSLLGIIALVVAFPFNRDYQALFGEIDFSWDTTPLLALESHVGAQLIICTLGAIVLLGYVRHGAIENAGLLYTLGGGVILGLLGQWILRGSTDTLLYRLFEVMIVLGLVGIWTNIAWQSSDDPNDFNIPRTWLQSLSIAAMTAALMLVIFERNVLALYLGIGLSALIVWVGLERQSARFVAALIAAATLLGAALEVVYLVDDLDGSVWYRMNTIFKFYNQIWNLLGLASGVIVGIAVWRLLVWEEPRSFRQPLPVAGRLGANAVKLSVAVALPLMALMATYALVATPIRLDQRFGDGGSITLNAYSWMEYGHIDLQGENAEGPLQYVDDLAAIQWMNENIEGNPVILEAAYGTYRCNGSRFSVHTGLPSVIGWVRHERQQRSVDDLDRRESDVREFYMGADIEFKREFLEQHNVEYVIVGQTEEHYPFIDGNDCIDMGSPAAIEMIRSMEGEELEVVFQQGTTTIFRVVRQ
ncbi:MAG: DUF2298 domain-containing protein [Thermomicrobiales bacterium]|nr:DUF2298 domain-containing protein [Thermomicrobiales bacterium]